MRCRRSAGSPFAPGVVQHISDMKTQDYAERGPFGREHSPSVDDWLGAPGAPVLIRRNRRSTRSAACRCRPTRRHRPASRCPWRRRRRSACCRCARCWRESLQIAETAVPTARGSVVLRQRRQAVERRLCASAIQCAARQRAYGPGLGGSLARRAVCRDDLAAKRDAGLNFIFFPRSEYAHRHHPQRSSD